jgi:hypothetical protein
MPSPPSALLVAIPEAELRTGQPVTGRAEHLSLFVEDDDGRWSVLHRFAFGPVTPG